MDAVVVGVVGSLTGVALGWLGSFTSQEVSYRRNRRDRLADERRLAYLDWLAKVHSMFEQIASIYRQVERNELDVETAARRLRAISSEDAQTALENVRLVSSQDLAVSAAQMWGHMRRVGVPIGQFVDLGRWRKWRDEYWNLRRCLVNDARREIGLDVLDWSAAGIVVGRPDEK